MKNIKDLRIEKGYSQEGLATVSGISLRTIQRIENGKTKPRTSTLNILASSLGVNADQLLQEVATSSKENGNHIKYAIINGLTYLVFPIAALLIVKQKLSIQEGKKARLILSNLYTLDVIVFSFSILIIVFWKLIGWSSFLEQGMILNHLISTIIVLVTGVLLMKGK